MTDEKKDEKFLELAEKTPLTPRQQKILWARVTTVKRILVRHGLTTHEEFEEMVAAMHRDIIKRDIDRIKETVGLADEDDEEE